MKIISFAWTTPAVKARMKTCTRRDWADAYAARFHAGDLLQAYDKNPRNGGKPFGIVRLTRDPYQERCCDVPMDDWDNEGFGYLTGIGATVDGLKPIELWEQWKLDTSLIWVIRFEIVELTKNEGNSVRRIER